MVSNLPHLPEEVLSHYDLGAVYTVEPQGGSWTEATFSVVAETGRYVFKQRASSATLESVAADHDLILYLAGCAFPTPAPLPCLDGQTWVDWEGSLYEAFPFVEGEGFTMGDRQQIASLGRTLGWFHHLVSGYEPTYYKLPAWGETSLAAFFDLHSYIAPRLQALQVQRKIDRQAERFVRDTADRLRDEASRLADTAEVGWLIVHGAVEPGNVIFDPRGGIAALVDWSDSAYFVRIFDVASALLKFVGRRADAMLPGQTGPLLPWPRVEAFALAYRETIALSEAEGMLLPWLMITLRLIDALWMAEDLPIDYRHELEMTQQLVEWLLDDAETLQNVFCA